MIDYINMEEFREIIGRLGGVLVLKYFCVIIKNFGFGYDSGFLKYSRV